MPVQFRSAQTTRLTASGTTLDAALPAGVQERDVLVCVGGNSGPGAMTMNGWNQVKDVAAGGDCEGAIWWKTAGNSEPATYPITISGATSMFGIIAAYTGALGYRIGTSNPTSTNSATTGTTTSPAPTALTGIKATEMIIQACSVTADTSGQATTTLNYPSSGTFPGWNQRAKLDLALATGSSWCGGCGLIDQIGSSALPTWTVASLVRQWVMLSIVLTDAPTSGFLPFFGAG